MAYVPLGSCAAYRRLLWFSPLCDPQQTGQPVALSLGADPLQVFAVLNILLMGYSRVYEGSHWLTDALGGYLFGALFLALLILLYRWTLDRLAKRHDRRLLEKSAQHQQA